MNAIAEEHGLYVSSGEGSSDDLFAFECFGEEYLSIEESDEGIVARDAWGDIVYIGVPSGLKVHMRNEGHFPDLVWISDHGNVSRWEA